MIYLPSTQVLVEARTGAELQTLMVSPSWPVAVAVHPTVTRVLTVVPRDQP